MVEFDATRPVAFDGAARARVFEGLEWSDVLTRRELLPDLPAQVLLHAGPPFPRNDPRSIPVPVLQAAAQALLFEGAADSFEHALEQIQRLQITLKPAQDHGIATPLAQVVSASMPLAVISDGETRLCAPLIEGPPPALRFGSAEPDCIRRLRHIADWAARALTPALRGRPVALDRVVAQALAAGDDCHARTGAANHALLTALDGLDSGSRRPIEANPGFVLPVLMAASGAALRMRSPDIVAAGGNGLLFGMRLAGAGSTWHTCPASAPVGPRLPGREQAGVLGAIGDSALIDFAGLGGQALASAPALLAEWRGFLPADASGRAARILEPASQLPSLDRILMQRCAPIVHLAMLDSTAGGLIGRGFYEVPLELFDSLVARTAPAPAPAPA